MKKYTPALLAIATTVAACHASKAAVIGFRNQSGFLNPDLVEMFSPSGQTFTDIGTTLDEEFLVGVDLTVTGIPESAADSVTFNPNGSFILANNVSIIFKFSAPVTGTIFGGANWQLDPNGSLTFGPNGVIEPGRNAINYDRLTVNDLTVTNETGETFYQASVAFDFTGTNTAFATLSGSSGVLYLDVSEVVPEPSSAVLMLLTVGVSITFRALPRSTVAEN